MPPKKKPTKTSSLFEGLNFTLCGKAFKKTNTQAELKKLIEEHSGSVLSSLSAKVTHVVTTLEEAPHQQKAKDAKVKGVFVLNEDFIHDSIAAAKKEDENKYVLTWTDAPEEKKEEKKEDVVMADATASTSTVNIDPSNTVTTPAPDTTSSASGRPKRKASTKTKADESSSEEEEETKPAAKKTKTDSPKPDEEEKKVKIVRKGRAAVDTNVSKSSAYHVYEEGDDIWDCMLNQTNISQNNNKFYVIQLLETDGGGSYAVWNRWGRVGEKGQNSLKPCGTSLPNAKKDFMKKFKDKTSNNWDERKHFKAKPQKYTLIEIDYGAEAEEVEEEKEKKR